MKFVVVGQFGTEDFGLHISENLEKMGHSVVAKVSVVPVSNGGKTKIGRLQKLRKVALDNMRNAKKNVRDLANKRILREVCAQNADVVLCTKDYFLGYEIQTIRNKTGAKVCMWFPDSLSTTGRASFLLSGYDAVFFKDKYMVYEFREIHAVNAFYLPECYSPIRHVCYQLSEDDKNRYRCEIAVAGNLHAQRVAMLRQLNQYDLKIYGTKGPWWVDMSGLENCYTGQYIAYQEKAKLFQSASVCLNTTHFSEIDGQNCRTFETLGAGGLLLTRYTDGVEELFEDGVEALTYRTMDELKGKVDFCIKNPEKAKQIAERGQKRAEKCHTYEIRLNRMIRLLGKSSYTTKDVYDYTQ